MIDYIWPRITVKTTIDELKEIHQRIWDHVMTHDFFKPMTPYMCNCAACEYVEKKLAIGDESYRPAPCSADFCEHCPIKWQEGQWCLSRDGLYSRFVDAQAKIMRNRLLIPPHDVFKAFKLVEQIRNVEWKDDNP